MHMPIIQTTGMSHITAQKSRILSAETALQETFGLIMLVLILEEMEWVTHYCHIMQAII